MSGRTITPIQDITIIITTQDRIGTDTIIVTMDGDINIHTNESG